jgi:hypothetical protein
MLEPDRARGAAARVLVTLTGGGYRLRVSEGRVDAMAFEDLVATVRSSDWPASRPSASFLSAQA